MRCVVSDTCTPKALLHTRLLAGPRILALFLSSLPPTWPERLPVSLFYTTFYDRHKVRTPFLPALRTFPAPG
jgi:hypothetical protein